MRLDTLFPTMMALSIALTSPLEDEWHTRSRPADRQISSETATKDYPRCAYVDIGMEYLVETTYCGDIIDAK